MESKFYVGRIAFELAWQFREGRSIEDSAACGEVERGNAAGLNDFHVADGTVAKDIKTDGGGFGGADDCVDIGGAPLFGDTAAKEFGIGAEAIAERSGGTDADAAGADGAVEGIGDHEGARFAIVGIGSGWFGARSEFVSCGY